MSAQPEISTALSTLLQGLMATDNETRSAAERALEDEWRLEQKVSILLLFLADSAVNGANDTIKSFSAVLFRRLAIRSPKDFGSVTERTFNVLPKESKEPIKASLLNGFRSEGSSLVRRRLADAIAEVAREDTDVKNLWPELLPTLFEACSCSETSLRESAFRVFGTTPEIIDINLVDQTLPIFNGGFEDQDDDVRIAACTAFVSYFRELPKSRWLSLALLLPNLLNSLPRFLSNGQDQALANVLESLIDLIELAPKMFKDMFPTIIEFCSTVIKDKSLESETRLGSLELLTTFAEVSPAMCKNTTSYTSAMVYVNLMLLTEVSADDDEAYEWLNNHTSEEEDDEPEYEAARQSLDRVALKLGGESLAGPIFQYLPAMFTSSNWRETFAALMALSAIAEGCADVLESETSKLLDLVLPCIENPHPRVQYACCNALGQLSTDFAGSIQRTSGDRIVPALISKLTNKSVPRVQAHAAAALVNFSEVAPARVLEPYLDDLLNNLLSLLHSPKRYVQEQVLTTIAIIADAADKKFIKYHDALLTLLINFLKSDLGPEYRLLQAKCIECSTLIASAVGKENFLPYSQELIGLFVQLQNSILEVDDPVKSYLEQGWGRICKLIGSDFLEFIPLVLPPLLSSAKAAQDISLLEEDQAEEFSNNDEWDVINLSGKLIAVHTAALDEKVSALDLIRIYATQLGGDFLPWAGEIVDEIAIPALDFYLHDGVRASAALTLAALFKCTVLATSLALPQTLETWAKISGKLIDALENEPVPELLVAYYTALVECITFLGSTSMSDAQMKALSRSISFNLEEIYSRLKQRDNQDDEFTEDIENDDEYTDEELLDEINRFFTVILRAEKTRFLPFFEAHFASLLTTLIADDNTSIKICGLGIFCDLLANCGETYDGSQILAYVISDCLTASQTNVRQAAAYSISVAAQSAVGNYERFCLESLPTLLQVASFPDSRAEENITTTENCVASIASIFRVFGRSIPESQKVLEQWVALLPVLHDKEAAGVSYLFLSDLIQNQHPTVISSIPKVVESIIVALNAESVPDNAAEQVVSSLKELLSSLPQDQAVNLVKTYAEDRVLKKWFS